MCIFRAAIMVVSLIIIFFLITDETFSVQKKQSEVTRVQTNEFNFWLTECERLQR